MTKFLQPQPDPANQPQPVPTDEPQPAPTDEPQPAPADEPQPGPSSEPQQVSEEDFDGFMGQVTVYEALQQARLLPDPGPEPGSGSDSE